MSLATLFPPRPSNYPHHRMPMDSFSPRTDYTVRPLLAPMSRAPRIETAFRRDKDLPRDPSNWVDKDLLSYVETNYSPVDASLSRVITENKLTPRALWYLQSDHDHLLAIARGQPLFDTLLALAESVQPAVSPTTPRIRHVRGLSEELARPPPPPPPPPPPSPPPAEEPEPDDDDDVAESVVSDWALDEDADLGEAFDHFATPAGAAGELPPPVEGLGLHTGEEHGDDVTAHEPEPILAESEDLINLEDAAPQETPPHDTPEALPTQADAIADPRPEEAIPQQASSAEAHVPTVAEEEPSTTTTTATIPGSADLTPLPPSDERPTSSSSQDDAAAGEPADPLASSNTYTSPIEDDLGNPWEDSSSDATPSRPQTADRARTATPNSDYHDANSTHGDEGEQPSPPSAELDTASFEQSEQPEGPVLSSGEDAQQLNAEVSPPAEEGVHDGVADKAGDDAPKPDEQKADDVNPAATESEELAPETAEVQEVVEPAPAPSAPVASKPEEELVQTEEVDSTSTATPEVEKIKQASVRESEEAQQSEVPVSPLLSSESLPSTQSDKTVKVEETVEADALTVGSTDKEQPVDRTGEGKEAKVSAVETAETETSSAVETSGQTDEPPVVTEDIRQDVTTSDAAISSSSGGDGSSTEETKQVPAPEPEVDSSSQAQTQGNQPEALPSLSEPETAATDVLTPPAATAVEPQVPSSPTVKLKSGLEVQLVSRDPESTEQTPASSADGTPTSQSASSSRQTSPPAEVQPSTPMRAPARIRISSSSSSSSSVPLAANTTEKKTPASQSIRIQTSFESRPESVRSAGPSVNSRQSLDGRTAQRPSAWGSASSPVLPRSQTPAPWPAAQVKSPASGVKSLLSSLTSSFPWGSQSEPTTRNPSQERAPPPAQRTPMSPARQTQGAEKNIWERRKESLAVANSSSASAQQPLKADSRTAPAPVPAPEQSSSANLVSASTPAAGESGAPPPPPSTSPTRAEGPGASPKPDAEVREKVSEALTDSVLVAAEIPSTGNGEPAQHEARTEVTQALESSAPSATATGGQGDVEGAVGGEPVEITMDDVRDIGKETGAQAGTGRGENEEDDDEDAPLDKRLVRVRQVTGDSVSSTATSDTENGEDTEPSAGDQPQRPRLNTTSLPGVEAGGVDSPVVESPDVGGFAQAGSAVSKKSKRKKRQGKNQR